MGNEWTKLTVKGQKKDLDDICAVVSMLDEGLLIEDFSDLKINEMYGDLIDESVLNADPDRVSVSIFVDSEHSPSEYVAFLRERFSSIGISADISLEGICEEDWAETWKKYYHPVKIGRVTVVPAWEEYAPAEGEVTVKMDPGMAFGTGTHETTRLVIRMLQDEIRRGDRVLDVGTGSGILSICASKLGASYCGAYDIDPIAVKVAEENVRADGAENIVCGVSDLLSGVDKENGGYDLVLANIVADIVIRMLPDLSGYVNDGGRVILSGIIAPRAEEIINMLPRCGFRLVRRENENDWCALLAKKA